MGRNSRRRASPCSPLCWRSAPVDRRWLEHGRGYLPSRQFSRRRPPSWSNFVAHEIIVALTLGNHSELVPVDEHFCRAGARVVVGRHYESVRTRRLHRKKIARLGVVDLPVESEEIPAFANWPDNIGYSGAARRIHSLDPVKRVVMRGSEQVRHSSVGDDEFLAAAPLSVENPGQQDSGIANQESSGFQNYLQAGTADQRAYHLTELPDVHRALGCIVSDGETAPDV